MNFFVFPVGLFFFMFVFFALALTGFILSYVFFTEVCID